MQWTQLGVRALLTNCLHVTNKVCRTWGISAPDHLFLATRSVLSIRTTWGHAPDGPHLGGTYLGLLHGVPWESWRARHLQFSPLGIDYRYKATWWIVKFCWFCRISLPSSLEVWSARRVFKLVWICAFSHSSTTLNIGSSLWALAQSVTCISTIGQAAVTHTSCSTHWSPSIKAGSWVSAWCAAPRATLLRTDFTDLLCGNQWWKCAIILQINACIRSDTTKI